MTARVVQGKSDRTKWITNLLFGKIQNSAIEKPPGGIIARKAPRMPAVDAVLSGDLPLP
jgi:hypothetical protein